MTMTIGQDEAPAVEAKDRIAVAAGLALLASGLLLVAVVLPAEYGLDPLGTGSRLGLMEISATDQKVKALQASLAADPGAARTPVVGQEREFKQEAVAFTLGPGESVEYKYRLDKGEALLYSWNATSQVEYDFHAEPDGAPRGYAQSYQKDPGTTRLIGTLTAPFSGIHGWYWKNRGAQAVTITLNTAGFYNLAHEFREGGAVKNKTF